MEFNQRITYFKRGISNKCPRCGVGAILKTLFVRHEICPHCQMKYDRGDGFFSAAMAINYALIAVLYFLPLMLLWLIGWLPGKATVVLCFLGVMTIPILSYRYSQALWLGLYYYVTSENLEESQKEVEK